MHRAQEEKTQQAKSLSRNGSARLVVVGIGVVGIGGGWRGHNRLGRRVPDCRTRKDSVPRNGGTHNLGVTPSAKLQRQECARSRACRVGSDHEGAGGRDNLGKVGELGLVGANDTLLNIRDGRGLGGRAALKGSFVLQQDESVRAGDGAGVAEEEDELAVLSVDGKGEDEGDLGSDVGFDSRTGSVVEILDASARCRAIG